MASHPPEPSPPEPVKVSAAIRHLTNREADELLVQAEAARRAEIDEYWALCLSDPSSAVHIAATTYPTPSPGPDPAAAPTPAPYPIMRAIHLLAGYTVAPLPEPGSIEPMVMATSRLLAEPAVREGLIGDYEPPVHLAQVDSLWEYSRIVAVRVVREQTVAVLRFDGPMFNPGTVPEAALTHGADWFVVRSREDVCDGEVADCLIAYVFGAIGPDGAWKRVELNLTDRSELMRDLPAMERLVDRGRITDAVFDVDPLPDFPTSCDATIAQLKAHKAALRLAGAMPAQWRAVVEARTERLHLRIDQLRRRVKLLEAALSRLRVRVQEVEACTLEEETGFARGDTVRHTSTGKQGVLEIAKFDQVQFRLCGTTMYVTEDIRRGEWEVVKAGGALGETPLGAPPLRNPLP